MEQDVVRAIEFRGLLLGEGGHQSYFLVQRQLGDRAASLGNPTEPPKSSSNRQQTINSPIREHSRALYRRKNTLGVAVSAQSQQSQGLCRERRDRRSEFLQIDGIKNDFVGHLAWTQKTLRGIPAKCALINNKVRHRAKPAHRTIIAFEILARPCGIGDAILVQDDRNLMPLASFQEIFGEGGMSAADKIQEVERAFIALESVAKMNELDRTSMQEANPIQHPAKRENGMLAWTTTDSREGSGMRQACRQSEGSAHYLTDVA